MSEKATKKRRKIPLCAFVAASVALMRMITRDGSNIFHKFDQTRERLFKYNYVPFFRMKVQFSNQNKWQTHPDQLQWFYWRFLFNSYWLSKRLPKCDLFWNLKSISIFEKHCFYITMSYFSMTHLKVSEMSL